MLAIVGPTASGKSSVGECLVSCCNYSVINFDSCQVSAGFPVLKAMPESFFEHYLYAEENAPCNVFDWCCLAVEKLRVVKERGRFPVFIGGTALYLKSLIEGVDCLPQHDLEVEKYVFALLDIEVWSLLKERDPKVLSVYSDQMRLRRALAFVLSHGFSLLDAFGRYRKTFLDEPVKVLALLPEKDVLWQRIQKRLIRDFEAMVCEVQFSDIEAPGLIGFCEIKKFLSGEISKEECFNLIMIRTRRYAKRQSTFIRNSLKCDVVFSCVDDLQEYCLSL